MSRCRSLITGVTQNVRTYPELKIDPESNQAPLNTQAHDIVKVHMLDGMETRTTTYYNDSSLR
jgi:hypothetical protein